MLKYMLTNLETNAIAESDWAEGDTNWREKGVLKKFYQDEFLDTSIFQVDGLAKFGYVYYPNRCLNWRNKCKVHMHLHGCGFTADGVLYGGWEKVTQNGWMEYAAANDIIVIQPQARFSLFANPVECFDALNYVSPEDETFITKDGS